MNRQMTLTLDSPVGFDIEVTFIVKPEYSVSDIDLEIKDVFTSKFNREPTQQELEHIWSMYPLNWRYEGIKEASIYFLGIDTFNVLKEYRGRTNTFDIACKAAMEQLDFQNPESIKYFQRLQTCLNEQTDGILRADF